MVDDRYTPIKTKKNKLVINYLQLSLFIFAIFIIIFRYFLIHPNYIIGQKIRITSKVTSEPIRYSNSQYLNIEGLKIYLPLYPEINYGDVVVIEGTVDRGKLVGSKLIKVKESDLLLYSLRKRLLAVYQRNFSEPYSSLVAGVTIGSKASIPEDFWNSLKSSGTAHVVVASGMNVTLIAGFLINGLTALITRKKALIITLLGIWIYCLIVGMEAPIIRAGIMGSLVFIAQGLGRLYQAKRALIISALVMLVIKPIWITDLGFILSFTATGSLLLFNGRVKKLIIFLPRLVKESLSTTLAAQIGVAPILYISFGQFNILSPLINVLVLWTIPFITILGMLGGLVGILFEPLGRLIFLISYPFAWWFVTVVRLFS